MIATACGGHAAPSPQAATAAADAHRCPDDASLLAGLRPILDDKSDDDGAAPWAIVGCAAGRFPAAGWAVVAFREPSWAVLLIVDAANQQVLAQADRDCPFSYQDSEGPDATCIAESLEVVDFDGDQVDEVVVVESKDTGEAFSRRLEVLAVEASELSARGEVELDYRNNVMESGSTACTYVTSEPDTAGRRVIRTTCRTCEPADCDEDCPQEACEDATQALSFARAEP